MKTRESQREYQRKWLAQRKADFYKDKSCVQILSNGSICGSIEGLELDHIDPSTKISHNIWSWREERRLAEIAKCQVLCHSCHKTKSAAEHAKGTDFPHSKLKEPDVRKIRQLYTTETYSLREIGKLFDVDHSLIWQVVNNKIWTHIE